MRGVLIGLALLAAQDTTPAQPNELSKLTGQLVITGESMTDPAPDQKSDRVGLFWDGESAKRVYDAMQAKAVDSPCEEGMRQKSAGGLECFSHSDGTYACSAGIMLATGKTRSVSAC
ncbi:hypothetical protein [Caulobacter sp. 17J65-9]|uniref:hypothetical protein n=1 Tax=Caulobacter sp. 17J65-9 TaxID=2709382 RepID=UPI0013CCF76F|nr:hypothetical protein [Caulobacter sp. 17J65-9]NEX91664.1 hypothetical protein [Caulobacter sp. 17J65-9]